MGVALTIGATLLGGYLSGRAAQQEANAQAQQAEQQAQIAYNNSEKMQKQAEQEAQNNAINEENKRRQLARQMGQQRAAAGAAGITMSGSAAEALATSKYNMETDLAKERYNGRQQVDNYFQSSTDYLNQGDIYTQNAKDYRKAGKRAMMNSMLQSAASLALGLYGANAVAKTAGSAASTASSSSGIALSNYGGVSGTAGWSAASGYTYQPYAIGSIYNYDQVGFQKLYNNSRLFKLR